MKRRMMKAIVTTGYGAPDVLKLQKVEQPLPKDNEVLVQVHASLATAADGHMRKGKPYIARLFTGLFKPKHPIPGTAFAGLVEAIGKDVSNFQVGDQVFGETTLHFSANAEYLVAEADGIILPMPEEMSYTDATTFCDGPLTSMNFLKEIGEIKSGMKVLINGASGSLGTAAVQLAKYYGAEVTGVCSTRNMELVKSLGADYVIDYTTEDFTRNGATYDIIYDTVGKSSFGKCKRSLSTTGQYLSPVLQFPILFQMLWTSMYGKRKAKFAATGMKSVVELRGLLSELVNIFREGKFKMLIDRQYPLEKLAEAHTYIDSGRKKGNVVILTQS